MIKHCSFFISALLLMVALLTGCTSGEQQAVSRPSNKMVTTDLAQPNVLLIVLDDVGFNDLGVFGGEINTPTIDSLARNGVILTDFHAAPTCSPTRAMLMSGTDNHIAGLGTMHGDQTENQKGVPGYEGHLNSRVAALPELFQDAGYNTYMTGKWHLGLTAETGPAGRGFDKSFSMLQGGAGAFANMLSLFGPNKALYQEDGQAIEQLPKDFYSTRFYTERMIRYVDENRDTGKPFFAYLAYTAPHWPLQAPQESIARHKGKYDAGYDQLLASRMERAKQLGWMDADAMPFPRLKGKGGKPWNELSQDEQQYQARIMEVYAAMVDDVDRYLGKLLDYLKTTGQFDNTLIFFMSDNGPEGHDLSIFDDWVKSCCNNSLENIGNADSYVWYGPNWAQAGNAPMRMYKGYTGEGGIRVPAFFYYPRALQSGERVQVPTHVMDVLPTLIDVAGIEQPGAEFRGRKVEPVKGYSLLPLLQGTAQAVYPEDHYLGWELYGKRAIRKGDWKIVYVPYLESRVNKLPVIKMDTWQLYNVADDPTETRDLASQNPEKLAELVALWDDYAVSNGVVLPDKVNEY